MMWLDCCNQPGPLHADDCNHTSVSLDQCLVAFVPQHNKQMYFTALPEEVLAKIAGEQLDDFPDKANNYFVLLPVNI